MLPIVIIMLKQLVHLTKTASLTSYHHGNPWILRRGVHTTNVSCKKANRRQEDEKDMESDDDENEIELQDKRSKIMNVKVGSLRLDYILKVGLGMARNKIETNFYESKIRLNGAKIHKKSVSVSEGDEIDVIHGISPSNSNFLNVARVEVLRVAAGEDHIAVKLRRCKSLLVENDSDNTWKMS